MPRLYDCFGDFLRLQKSPKLCITFSEIQKECKGKLPNTAYKHRAYWSNSPSHPLMKRVLAASWRTHSVDMQSQTVWFERHDRNDSRQSKTITHTQTDPPEQSGHDATKDVAGCKSRVCVVTACGASKSDEPCEARLLYKSPRIRAVYNRKNNCDMYIFSAKHGLLPSEKVIAPYNQIMTPERCKELLPDMVKVLKKYDCVVYFRGGASKLYEDSMKKACEMAGRPIDSFGFKILGKIGELEARIKKACESSLCKKECQQPARQSQGDRDVT